MMFNEILEKFVSNLKLPIVFGGNTLSLTSQGLFIPSSRALTIPYFGVALFLIGFCVIFYIASLLLIKATEDKGRTSYITSIVLSLVIAIILFIGM